MRKFAHGSLVQEAIYIKPDPDVQLCIGSYEIKFGLRLTLRHRPLA